MTNAEIESWVVDACRELGLPVENGDDDFFAAGGNSLSAVKIIAKAERAFGEDALPPEDLFRSGKVSEIASTIVANRERARVAD